ncbi:MAG: hypothetical protein EBZ49_03015 [Proteobacteria bacterium]|nr:hypothetical protein [Pseudomonadota bacterium]
MKDYKTRLATEAVFVGATLIPFVMFAESKLTTKPLAIFLAGASYHLVAEFSGLNSWYLENGASTLCKIQEVYHEAQPTTRNNTQRLI